MWSNTFCKVGYDDQAKESQVVFFESARLGKKSRPRYKQEQFGNNKVGTFLEKYFDLTELDLFANNFRIVKKC